MDQVERDQFSSKSAISSAGLGIGADNPGKPVRLVQLKAGEAIELGKRFAELEPWRSYNSTATSLSAFLTEQEKAGRRAMPFIAMRNGLEPCVAGRTGSEALYLQFLGMLPEAQSQGIGASVLRWPECTAAAGGGRHVWNMVAEGYHDARRF